MEFDLKIGMSAKLEHTVKYEDTANALNASLPKVYSTPSLTALIELASFEILAPHLPEGYSAVGTIVNLEHLAATPVGMKVWAQATLVGIDRRRISFKVTAYDEKEKIGEADHDRFIIDTGKFLRKTYEKADA